MIAKVETDVTLRSRQPEVIWYETGQERIWRRIGSFLAHPRANEREMTTEPTTIREMCDTFGVTPRTLRFYEQKELLFPQRDGQKRIYSRRDRARLKLILKGKRFGFSLEDIRQLLDMYDTGAGETAQLARSYELAEMRLAEMQAQRDELDRSIAELKNQMAWGAEVLATMRRTAAE